MIIIGIFGIRDGLKNGFPKSTGGWEDEYGVNPANGLPMIDGTIDVCGNPLGADTDWD